MQTVSERKLRALDSGKLAELQSLDFLAACYLILGSTYQFHRVIRLHNQKGNDRIVGLRLDLQSQEGAAAAGAVAQ